MKAWMRYLVCGVVGLAVGGGGAMWSVRAGALGATEMIGPWGTGRNYGTQQASAYTRAIVALYGLLALPPREARYYNAGTDDQGRPLDGRCRYRVAGGTLPAKWWSLTLYDAKGYLVANPDDLYSVGSVGLPLPEQAGWTVMVSPTRQAGHWLPTGGEQKFTLTLRTYLPIDGGKGNLTPDQLPHISREGC